MSGSSFMCLREQGNVSVEGVINVFLIVSVACRSFLLSGAKVSGCSFFKRCVSGDWRLSKVKANFRNTLHKPKSVLSSVRVFGSLVHGWRSSCGTQALISSIE